MSNDIDLLDEEIKTMKNNIYTDRMDMSFGEIISMYERDEISIDPEFQRLYRWDDAQKTRFIESLLLGIPVPPIFVAENEKDGTWEIVDGLQRLSTLFSFFGFLKSMPDKNKWELGEGDLVKGLKGYSVSNLPSKFQLNIRRASCRIEIIKCQSDMAVRYELFYRLNTGGSTLTEQEIRNCIFRGVSNKFNRQLSESANNERFLLLIDPTEKQISELFLDELVLRFLSLVDYRADILEGKLSRYMTKYMEKMVKNNEDQTLNLKLLTRVTDLLLSSGCDVKTFRFNRGGFSSSLYDAVMIGIAKNIDYYEQKQEEVKNRVSKIKEDKEFRNSTGSGTGTITQVMKRIDIALSVFNDRS